MTKSDDSSDEGENDESSNNSIVRTLEMTKRLLEVAILTTQLITML